MIDITSEVNKIIGKGEGLHLEYKAVLPPSRNIAQLICAFANTEGGFIILGILEKPNGQIEISGLSEDFRAKSITHKAIDLLTPKPQVVYQYVLHDSKKLYAIKIDKSDEIISLEGRIYIRDGAFVRLKNPDELGLKEKGLVEIKTASSTLDGYKLNATYSKIEIITHYKSTLKILDDLGHLFYPENSGEPTAIREGRILMRLLFSSVADSFEIYLSELLYEIFLAKPQTLISDSQTATLKEVLSCSDMQEFIEYWAKKKLGKLQRGSVKAFIDENDQIKKLNAIRTSDIDEIEKIFQIRHLYAHKNGIIDEKFVQNMSENHVLGEEHRMSVDEVCNKLLYLAEIVNKVDTAAIQKYKLATV